MTGVLTFAEIKEQYDGEWVLIEYTELDEDLQPVAGVVIAHAPRRDDIYRELLRQREKSVAIEYFGVVPEDLATAL